LLTKGTATRTAPEIARQVEALGATLEVETAWDAIQIELKTLSSNASAAFEILADVVRNPKFAPEEIDRQRRQTLDELRVEWETPGPVARAVAARAVLGTSPYAYPPNGTLASLPRVKRDDLLALHRRNFVPANALIVMAGNVTADEGFALAEQTFGDWKTGDAPARPHAGPAGQKPRAMLIDLPHAGQAAVYFAAPSLARTDTAFTAAEVTNAVLGTGYSSRLNQEIRLKRGLSYGVRSRLTASREFGLFAAGCQTKNESAAEVVSVIQTELKRLVTELVPPDYLAARKAVLTGDFSRELETNEGYVNRITELALHDLPLDALAHRIERIEAVTAEEISARAAERFSPENMTVIVVGRAQDAAKSLRKIFPKLEVIPQSKLDLEAVALGAPSSKAR
jgi:zinc protease